MRLRHRRRELGDGLRRWRSCGQRERVWLARLGPGVAARRGEWLRCALALDLHGELEQGAYKLIAAYGLPERVLQP